MLCDTVKFKNWMIIALAKTMYLTRNGQQQGEFLLDTEIWIDAGVENI